MAKCELIELKDLTPDDRIELAPLEGNNPTANDTTASWPGSEKVLERQQRDLVVRLVGDCVSVEEASWGSAKQGRGHNLQPCSHAQLTWCDLCGEFIWGLYKQSLRCVHCKYTCHYRCQPFIQLDCGSHIAAVTGVPDYSEDIETDTNVDDLVEWSKQQLSASEIQQKIKEFNAQINNNLYMVLHRDASYTGFIKVQFKLARPVSLPPPPPPPPPPMSPSSSSSWSCQDGVRREGVTPQRRTSFYLPRDAAKHLHVSSRTLVREVIEALLNKFSVVDNPAKFALYERSERNDQVYIRKLSDDECPLHLRLCAGPSEKVLSFVLKENETGEVNWDAFSLPELRNFLRILQREEEDHVRQIVQRYSLARGKMQEALRNFGTPG